MFLLAFLLFFSLGGESCTLFNGFQTTEEGPQVLCKECGFSGYLSEGACKCLTPAMDPQRECFAPGIKNETVEKVFMYYEAPCTCDHTFERGFWRLSESKKKLINGSWVYQWGDGPPPTCSLCFNPYYGPAPGLQTYSLKNYSSPACGEYGAQDPVLVETSAPTLSPGGAGRRELDEQFIWSVCAGHGDWNSDWNGCECTEGWGLEVVGKGYNDTQIPVCQICQGPWGPLVPSQQNSIPFNNTKPFCSVVFTPDPLDGVLKECGGHGSYFGGCICDNNPSLGFWTLSTYEMTQETLLLVGPETYEQTVVSYTAQTCQSCLYVNDTPPCLQTLAPTLRPTDSPSFF